jgi:hypothetical protein
MLKYDESNLSGSKEHLLCPINISANHTVYEIITTNMTETVRHMKFFTI